MKGVNILATKTAATPAEIRAWAQKRPSLAVGERGRISAGVRDAYEKAHKSK